MGDGGLDGITLEAPLNPMAIIRTTFETLEQFADDKEIQAEMMGMLNSARRELVAGLASLRDAIRDGRLLEHADHQYLKESALRMSERGWNGPHLDRMMKTDAFTEDLGFDEPLFWVDRYRDLPPRAFVAMLMDDIRTAATAVSSYMRRSEFDSAVYQRYTAFLFLCYSATDPSFYERP